MKRLLTDAIRSFSQRVCPRFRPRPTPKAASILTNGVRLTAAQQMAAIVQLKASHAKITRVPLETWPVGGPVTLSVQSRCQSASCGHPIHLVVTLADTPQIYNSGAPYRLYNTTYPRCLVRLSALAIEPSPAIHLVQFQSSWRNWQIQVLRARRFRVVSQRPRSTTPSAICACKGSRAS